VTYTPLATKTKAASFAIIANVAFGIAYSLSWRFLLGSHPSVPGAVIVGIAGWGAVVSAFVAGVLFIYWMHAASVNAHAFERAPLGFTPIECVWWWFVPIAGLFQPYRALREIWRASDPDAISSRRTGVVRRTPRAFAVWWTFYVVSGALSVAAVLVLALNPSGGTLGITMIGNLAATISALAVLGIMRDLADRQEEMQRKLTNQPPISDGIWRAA
jgi:hypothetical protein